MLIFAEETLRHHIHIGRFKTTTMIIDDRQTTDTLFEAVDQAMKFIVSYISVAFTFTTLQLPVKTLERWVKQLRDEKKVIFKGPAKTGGYYVAGGDI